MDDGDDLAVLSAESDVHSEVEWFGYSSVELADAIASYNLIIHELKQ